MTLSVVTPAASLDLLQQVRDHLRLGDDTRSDARLRDILIPGAVNDVENRTGRQLLTATYRLTRPAFAPCLELPKPPLQAVTAITYLDDAGVEQTVAASAYIVHAPGGPTAARGAVSLAFGQTWPVPKAQADAVRVQFRAGYGAAPADVPAAVLTAILLLVEARFDEQPDDALERAAARLLAPFRSRAEGAA